MDPLEVTATPRGLLSFAFVPTPSAKPAVLPASVVTTPRGVTSRTRWFEMSATTMTPLDGITATPKTLQKLAAAPVPSAHVAAPLPASVVTTPSAVTSRIRLLFWSETTITSLEGITAMADGPKNFAFVPAPSAKACVPSPASVLTEPPG
jgi:hypothetical protein